jgi:hypothetical protein
MMKGVEEGRLYSKCKCDGMTRIRKKEDYTANVNVTE